MTSVYSQDMTARVTDAAWEGFYVRMTGDPLSALKHTQCLLDALEDSPPFTCHVSWRTQMEIGVVYDPCSDELFQAVRGYGSFVNGQRVSSSACSELGDAVVVSEILHQ